MSLRLFEANGIPMLGNPDNGFIIGLEPHEALACRGLLSDQTTLDEIAITLPELADTIALGFQDQEPPSHKTAYLHVTDRCNLQCRGCYSETEARNMRRDPSLDDLKAALKFLRQWGASELSVSGGEPLLRSDLAELLFEAKRIGIDRINVLTNGTICDREQIGSIAPYVDTISVSFDGVSSTSPAYIRKQNRFNQLLRFVGVCNDAGISTCITPTLHRLNHEDAPGYRRLARELGSQVSFSLLSAPANQSEIQDLLPANSTLGSIATELYESHTSCGDQLDGLCCRESCGAGSSVLSIAADGEIYPCHMLHKPSLSLGNAFSGNDINLDTKAFETAKRTISCSATNCDHFYLCGGGCIARAINTDTSVDPYCTLFKTFNNLLLSNAAQ